MSQPWRENLLLHHKISQFSISNPRTEARLKQMEVAEKGNKAGVHLTGLLAAEQADEANTRLVLQVFFPAPLAVFQK